LLQFSILFRPSVPAFSGVIDRVVVEEGAFKLDCPVIHQTVI
jgi:hypothetical protein